MNDLRSNLLSIIVISLVGLVINMLINTIFPSYNSNVYTIGFKVLIFISFLLMNYIFFRNSYKIPCGKVSKNVKYGILIGLMWMYGAIGYNSYLGIPIQNELIEIIKIFTPIIGMEFTLELIKRKNTTELQSNIREKRNSILIIGIFTLIYLGTRCASYCLNITISMYNEKPVYTLIWTIIMGVHIGIMYISLMKVSDIQRAIIECVKFGMGMFGTNWLTFSIISYINYSYKFNILEVLLTCSIDIAAVTLACYFAVGIDCNNIKGMKNMGQ
ncbi:hypothetical protein CHF27_009305 [Romboutsia maritimum]|uniref:Uncharacterized protein n=1 Tax=Romboutsia maritimum TaxID=2020948 RepID=A0A371IRX3_9FIRM|nr:hypothetical protein [Romboutsia maritimum]RDY23236.1 hypothetical protein CHF27_009305 [Romboutsia maritimum]